MNFEDEMLNGTETMYNVDEYIMDNNDDSSYYQDDEQDGGYAVMSDSASSGYKPTGKNKNRDSYESTDKNRHKLIRTINYKQKEIIVYTSPICPGACIRDAVTGSRYRDYLVGSVNEHQFFKVKFATGEMGQDSGSCFFDSPEQYEKHMHQNVTNELKDAWANKCASVRTAHD